MNYEIIGKTILFAYLLGSIPFGLIFTRLAGIGDIRNIGSGNIGATNVMRTGHKKIAILTLLFDAGKGAAAVYIIQYVFNYNYALIAGFSVVIGHVFPAWLRFKGGKGVATTLGVFLALNWMLGASVCAMWLLSFAMIRISSVSAILSICYSAIAAYLIAEDATGLLCLILSALIIFTHRSNIARLLEGTEFNFSNTK